MTLFKTSLLSFLSTVVKMFAGFVIAKTLAVFVGPSGLAVVGQFQNFVQLTLIAAKGGLDTGITKYTAEYGVDKRRREILFSTAMRLCAGSCLVVAAILLLGAEPLSLYLLKSSKYAYVIRLFSLTIILFVLNSVLLAIINGLQEIRRYIFLNILQSVVSLLLTVGLIVWLGLDGALVALVTNQSLILMAMLWALRGHPIINIVSFRSSFDSAEAIRLSKYSLMALVSAALSPFSTMLVRDYISQTLGMESAGYWQAIWYISSVYLSIVITSMSIYYLPKLSNTDNLRELRKELFNGYRIIIPITAASALTLYALRELVVNLLFSHAFLPILSLFCWMLIGDVIKISSWLLSFLMLAKAMTRAFILTEIVFSITFVVLTILMVRQYGLDGAFYAYAANYFLYLIAVAAITSQFWLKR